MQLKICLPGNKVVSFALSLFPFPSWAARKSRKQVEKEAQEETERQRQRTTEQATTLLMQSQTNMQMNGKCKGEKKGEKKKQSKARAKPQTTTLADREEGRGVGREGDVEGKGLLCNLTQPSLERRVWLC